MIARLKGLVEESTPLLVVLDVAGVGYEVHIPVSTAEKIPAIGQACTLFIHPVYREDSASLYGFATREDRDFFRLLVEKVSGIGPKIGITILSRMSVASLQVAIANSDVQLLSKCPGIGKKTAERLVIELKDKVFAATETNASLGSTELSPSTSNHFNDAVASLATLGYKAAEADKLIRKASKQLGSTATVEDLIREALR